MEKLKIISVVGPTASGKSALAVEIAKKINGEIISVDSRQIYRKLDLGSGKITKEEMAGVPHHLLDIISPETPYSGNDFKKDAEEAMAKIIERGKIPVLAGGTFFYLNLLQGKSTAPQVPPNQELRAELEKLETSSLFKKLQTLDPKYSEKIDKHNRRRLIRAIEVVERLGKMPEIKQNFSPFSWLNIGIKIEKDVLEKRISQRLFERLEKGLVQEVENLLQDGISPLWLISLGLEYRFITEYLQNKLTYKEMQEQIIIKSRQFAKRQYTWLKRENDILWFDFPVTLEKVGMEIEKFLNQKN